MPVVLKRNKLELWQDVIFALLVRQLTSKFNDKIGVSWLIIQPVLFILVLSFIRGRIAGNDVHGIPVFVFMLLGMGVVIQFLSTWTGISNCIRSDKPLYAFRQVNPFASFVTAALIEYISFIVVMCLLFAITLLMGIDLQIHDPLRMMLFLTEVQIMAISIGFLFAIATAFVDEVRKFQALLQRPLIFVSGAFFTLNDLPEEAWHYLSWNPLIHAVELSRGAAYQSFTVVSAIDANFLHMCTIVCLFLALSCYVVFWKRMISR